MTARTTETVTVSLDIGELEDSQQWAVKRRDIQWDGAAGVFDGFGHLGIRINGEIVAALTLQEDRDGYAVLVLEDIESGEPTGPQITVDLERERKLVPMRPAGKPSKREKWGG